MGLTLMGVAGCASPGPPLPPSLKLPRVVDDLAAVRAGDEVTLRWTTPSLTTDRMPIAEAMTAEVCREVGAAAETPAAGGKAGVTAPCAPVLRVPVKPGPSVAVDALPAGLTATPARVLVYRVQLRNADGHTAGPSAAVPVASGPAPAVVEGLTAMATKAGVLLRWTANEGGADDEVEVDRTPVGEVGSAGRAAAGKGSGRKSDLGGGAEKARFRVGVLESGEAKDGGAIDHTAAIGHTYSYTAQRVRTVALGGLKLEVRSAPSAAVTVEMRDVFPPDVPSGLVAVPGFTAVRDGAQTQRPAIDLSWQPVMEARVAGYRVYRRDLGGATPEVWTRVGAELVTVPAYRDATVAAGHRYAYRVTAVSEAGNESAPSGEVVEIAPGP